MGLRVGLLQLQGALRQAGCLLVGRDPLLVVGQKVIAHVEVRAGELEQETGVRGLLRPNRKQGGEVSFKGLRIIRRQRGRACEYRVSRQNDEQATR